MNYLLTLRYDGSAFHGWQRQPNGLTVQECLEAAIARATGNRSTVTGCSRTDAGVHAREFCCNFRSDTRIPAARLPAALNFYLPPQIAVLSCREVPEAFHARYDCAAKLYRYHIHNSAVRDPFLLHRAVLEPFPLNAELLAEEAKAFLGTHDFKAFCAAGSSVKSTERSLTRFDITREGEEIFCYIQADGFLYNMVRIMVGTLLDIAKSRLPQGSIPAILASCDRTQAGVTAPAEGLALWQVFYE